MIVSLSVCLHKTILLTAERKWFSFPKQLSWFWEGIGEGNTTLPRELHETPPPPRPPQKKYIFTFFFNSNSPFPNLKCP